MIKIRHEEFITLVMNEITNVEEKIIISLSPSTNTIHLSLLDDKIVIEDYKKFEIISEDGEISGNGNMFIPSTKHLELLISNIATKIYRMKIEFDKESSNLEKILKGQ